MGYIQYMTNDNNTIDDFDTQIHSDEFYDHDDVAMEYDSGSPIDTDRMERESRWMDEQEPCNWCNGLMPKRGTKYAPFCSYKCAKADAKDYEATERDKWAMRYEM